MRQETAVEVGSFVVGQWTKRGSVIFGFGVVLILSLVMALAWGSVSVSLDEVVAVFWRRLIGGDTDRLQEAILLQIRLPRVVVAALVGGALALAGTVMQALFRNPMADPGIIGVSSGGALGAVIAIFTGLAFLHPLLLPALALLGASLSAFLVYALAIRQGRTPVTTLLLAGIAVSSFLTALTTLLLSLTQNILVLRELLFWLMGGLDGRGWHHVRIVFLPVVLGGVGLIAFARELNLLASGGEEEAASLGVEVEWTKRILLLVASLITGLAVAVSGVIGFVGLVIPHLTRLLVGADHRILLPASFLCGAAFLTWADLVTRTIFQAEELRLGVVTAFVGAPFFLYLLWQRERGSRL
jgi:iron complex transport system permease protein